MMNYIMDSKVIMGTQTQVSPDGYNVTDRL